MLIWLAELCCVIFLFIIPLVQIGTSCLDSRVLLYQRTYEHFNLTLKFKFLIMRLHLQMREIYCLKSLTELINWWFYLSLYQNLKQLHNYKGFKFERKFTITVNALIKQCHVACPNNIHCDRILHSTIFSSMFIATSVLPHIDGAIRKCRIIKMQFFIVSYSCLSFSRP